MQRISKLFAERKNNILSVYFTAGQPKLNDTVEISKTVSDKGVDMSEIGIPYSDPMADGPVIQNSSQIALDNGMSQKILFEQLKDIRKVTDIPLTKHKKIASYMLMSRQTAEFPFHLKW